MCDTTHEQEQLRASDWFSLSAHRLGFERNFIRAISKNAAKLYLATLRNAADYSQCCRLLAMLQITRNVADYLLCCRLLAMLQITRNVADNSQCCRLLAMLQITRNVADYSNLSTKSYTSNPHSLGSNLNGGDGDKPQPGTNSFSTGTKIVPVRKENIPLIENDESQTPTYAETRNIQKIKNRYKP